MILVHPPVVRPSEPPLGVARLAGALKRHGIGCRVLDANVEGLFHLFSRPPEGRDTRTKRALRHLDANLLALRSPRGYEAPGRYRQSVLELNHVLLKSGADPRIRISLVNYGDEELSPLSSRDLLRAAELPERNPFHPYFSGRLESIIEESRPRVIGFSLNFLSQALTTFAMAGFIKARHPRIRLVFGGGLVTSWMSRPGWRSPFGGLLDVMVAGPGERSLVGLMGGECDGGAASPDFDPLCGNPYLAPGFILPCSASSGCYWRRCSFCPEKAEGNPYRPIAAAEVMDELDLTAGKKKPSLVHFLDNAMSPALLQEIIRRGDRCRPWYGFVRVSAHLTDPEFCRLLERSGCVMLKLGIESGSQEVLDRLEKGVDLGLVSRALRNVRNAGIGTYCYVLFGTPPEDQRKARETLKFVVRHQDCIDFLNVAVFNMPVSSPEAAAYGCSPFYEGDLSLYTDFIHPRGWDRPLVRTFLQKEFHRHPAIAAIVRRDPPLFTSSHAPFFASRDRAGEAGC